MMGMFYDREGNEIEVEEWAKLMRDLEYRRIARDVVDGSEISTVWIGANHNYHGGPPLIFETMVFSGPLDGHQRRYTTKQSALRGHWKVLRKVMDAQREQSSNEREDLIVPDESRPFAEFEPGSLDISGLDKAVLLAALINVTRELLPISREQAAALIQDRLGGVGDPGPVFRFEDVFGCRLYCDITGPRISAEDVARYDRDRGRGTMSGVIDATRRNREELARR